MSMLRLRCRSTLRVVIAVVGMLMVPVATFANNPFERARIYVGGTRVAARVSGTTLEETIGNLIQAALSLTGVFFFGFIVWAGYLWMTAHGESEKIEKAKKMISGAIIGLALTLAAYAITVFVVSRLTSPEGEGGAAVIEQPQ